MKKHRCKECTKFCTDDCKYREDVDTLTFACTSFEDRALYSSCEGEACLVELHGIPHIIFPEDENRVDLEKDKWTK